MPHNIDDEQTYFTTNTERINKKALNNTHKSAKSNKSTRIDDIPNESLKCERIKGLLLNFFKNILTMALSQVCGI